MIDTLLTMLLALPVFTDLLASTVLANPLVDLGRALARPFLQDGLMVELIWQFGIFLLIAISLDLVMGYTGMFQLGHIGFFALGAIGTTYATHADYLGMELFAGLLLGFFFTTLAVAFIGIPTLRLRGDYFAIATFGFTLSTQAVLLGNYATGIFNVPRMNPLGCDTHCLADTGVGGYIGRLVAAFFGLESGPPQDRTFFVDWSQGLFHAVIGRDTVARPVASGVELAMLFVVLIAAYVLIGRLKHAPLGRVLKSIREDHRAAGALGKNVEMFRFKALWVSALVQSLAGSLWVHHVGNMGPQFFGFEILILTLIAVILGGLGSHVGAFVGAFVFVLVNEESKSLSAWAGSTFPALNEFSLPSLRLVLFGLLLVTLMITRPQGIMGGHDVTLRGLWRRYVLRRQQPEGAGDGGAR